jgi:hypothetical protein
MLVPLPLYNASHDTFVNVVFHIEVDCNTPSDALYARTEALPDLLTRKLISFGATRLKSAIIGDE